MGIKAQALLCILANCIWFAVVAIHWKKLQIPRDVNPIWGG